LSGLGVGSGFGEGRLELWRLLGEQAMAVPGDGQFVDEGTKMLLGAALG
jgi:hypothetical protein